MAAKLLLKDFVKGKLLFCKLPIGYDNADHHINQSNTFPDDPDDLGSEDLLPEEQKIDRDLEERKEFDDDFFHTDHEIKRVQKILSIRK